MTEFYIHWQNYVTGYSADKPLHYPTNIKISRPGIYGILGSNGSGKTTFIKSSLGIISALQGQCILGDNVTDNTLSVKRFLSYAPQCYNLNMHYHISVEKMVAQGIGPRSKVSEPVVRQLLSEWELTDLGKASFHELSLGQKTKCILMRALISEPQVLFLDEPLASLDIHGQFFLLDRLKELVVNKKMCILMADHHLHSFERYLVGKIDFQKFYNTNLSKIVYHETLEGCQH